MKLRMKINFQFSLLQQPLYCTIKTENLYYVLPQWELPPSPTGASRPDMGR